MRKIVFYGDSNTYGFDPRSFFGDRYDAARIWTTLVAAGLNARKETADAGVKNRKGTSDDAPEGRWEVVNEGMNGRCVPDDAERSNYLSYLLSGLRAEDVFAVMLGTNDILMRLTPDAAVPVERMDKFLKWLLSKPDHPKVLLIAPPLVGNENTKDPYYASCRKECIKMTEGYRRLADKYQIHFADASGWGVELAYDQVHFSEEGHRIFAEELLAYLQK